MELTRYTKNDLENVLCSREPDKRLILHMIEMFDEDLSGMDLRNIEFLSSSFHNVNFTGANFENSDLEAVLLDDCIMENTNLRNTNLTSLRANYINFRNANICGAQLYTASLSYSDLTGVIADENTKHYYMRCPETGPFVAYKKCQDDRIVQLLVPADAKRSSATLDTCRCSKAKVLAIKSIDEMTFYDEAYATITDSFVYRKGEWVEADSFDPERWNDAAPGIHFWMSREEAIHY